MGADGATEPTNVYEWLSDAEARYSKALRRVSLVVEANLDPADVLKAARAIGGVYRRLSGHSDPWDRLSRYPATVVAVMVGSATLHFDKNTYWPRFFETIGLPSGQDDQASFGQHFLAFLGRFGLVKSDSHRKYLDSILMHAGIPDTCMEDFLNLLIDRKSQDPGLGAVSFMAWALDPNVKNRLSSLHVPVRNFLTQSGELALDIVERTMEVLAYLEGSRDAQALSGLTSETTGLPETMIRKLTSLVADGTVTLDRLPRRVQGARERQHHPRLTFDWIQGSVLLQLPARRTDSGAVVWSIAAAGDVHTLSSQAMWTGAREAPATAFRLSKPSQQLSITSTHSAEAVQLSLVNPADPLLLFDDDGNMLIPTLPVPAAPVWALWPAGRSLVDQDDRQVAFTVDESPADWPGWTFAQLDATRLRRLGLDSAAQSGTPRVVRREVVPVIELGDALPGVRTAQGLHVFPKRPKVLLPDDDSGVLWNLDVRLSGSELPIMRQSGLLASNGLEVSLDAIAAPMAGTFTIQVRGPLGRKASRTVAIAEGLDVIYDPAVRLPVKSDLQPCAARLDATLGGELSNQALAYDGKTVELPVTYRGGGRQIGLLIAPPHMELLLDVPGMPAVWSPEVRKLAAGDFQAAGDLLIRLPSGLDAYSLQLMSAAGHESQTLRPSARQATAAFRFKLSAFADTARRCVRADLVAQTSAGRVLVARVRPKAHASGVRCNGTKLQLIDFTPSPDLKAAVYAMTAPWIGPIICDVGVDGTFDWPATFGDAGSLRVFLAEDDGWGLLEWPEWPTDSFLECPRPGYRAAGDGSEQQLSRLIGLPSTMESFTERGNLAIAWSTLAVLDEILEPNDRHHITDEIRSALCDSPNAAAIALEESSIGRRHSVELLVRSRLAEQTFTSATNERKVGSLWSSVPVSAALITNATLADHRRFGLADDELSARVSLFGGDAMTLIQSGHRDPDREVGRFGENERRMGGMAKSVFDAMRSHLNIIPQGILHADARLDASLELFEVRKATPVQPLISCLMDELRGMRRLLDFPGNSSIRDQFEARMEVGRDGEFWQFLPALSFTYAARARLTAWLPGKIAPLSSTSRSRWRTLAKLSPKFVGMDIILADTLIAGANQSMQEGLSA